MKQFKTIFFAVILFAVSFSAFSQVSINTDGSSPNSNAMLDVKATDKGFLPPRVDLDDVNTAAPLAGTTAGMIIYNQGGDALDGLYMWDGSKWTRLSNYNSIGDFAHGGIVFWVDETGQHGLVCAKQDQSPGIRWYAGTYGYTRSKGDGPLSGEMNTAIIIASQVAIGDDGSTYAAHICAELQITEGGKTYGDWYLPSKEELNLMYQNKATINTTATANGGSAFATNYYWSSTESSNGTAWRKNFSSGLQNTYLKISTYYVRAIRAF